jgi:hypothetical protein
MTTTKHSPGPWTVDRNMIETESGEVIAQVSYKQDGYVRANARIMAGAREMRETLKLVMQHGRIDNSESRMNRVAALINATKGD